MLFEAANSDRIFLNATIRGVDIKETAVVLGDGRKLAGRVIVGADGVRSAVARGLGVPPPNMSGQMAFRGVAKFEGALPIAASTVCQVRAHKASASCSVIQRPLFSYAQERRQNVSISFEFGILSRWVMCGLLVPRTGTAAAPGLDSRRV